MQSYQPTAKSGSAALVNGTVDVAHLGIRANTRILLSVSAVGGTQGHLSTTRVVDTSFTINSSSNTDTSTVDWVLAD